MKTRKVGRDWFKVNFKYKKLLAFCFICGLIGRGEMFCHWRYEKDAAERSYGLWLRATNKGNSLGGNNRWLRDPSVNQLSNQAVNPFMNVSKGTEKEA